MTHKISAANEHINLKNHARKKTYGDYDDLT